MSETLTKEEIETVITSIKEAKALDGRVVHMKKKDALAICTLALQAIDMRPRPISEAKCGEWLLVQFRTTWCIAKLGVDYEWEDRVGKNPIKSFGLPTQFIPLSALPTGGE